MKKQSIQGVIRYYISIYLLFYIIRYSSSIIISILLPWYIITYYLADQSQFELFIDIQWIGWMRNEEVKEKL